jgi:hypothetical protein
MMDHMTIVYIIGLYVIKYGREGDEYTKVLKTDAGLLSFINRETLRGAYYIDLKGLIGSHRRQIVYRGASTRTKINTKD